MYTTMARISVAALTALFTVSNVKAACDDDTIFFQGVLDDIHLVADESMELLLEINNGVYEYCRILDLQSGEMSFEEVSCSNNVREWESIDAYDIEMVPSNNNTVSLSFGDDNETLTLDNGVSVYIDSTEFAYFYSPSMMTLFILTSDGADSSNGTINLVSITWASTDSDTDFPLNLEEFVYGVQYDIDLDVDVVLNGQLWSNYDGDDMFMLEVAPAVEGCKDGWPWVRYSGNLFSSSESDGDSDNFQTTMMEWDTGMQFQYIGDGFIGVDTRVQRAFGFDKYENTVWYYEADGDEFDEWRSETFEFGDAELTSYWIVMFVAIALFVFYCCCCCCCVYASRRRRNERKGTYDTTYDSAEFNTYV